MCNPYECECLVCHKCLIKRLIVVLFEYLSPLRLASLAVRGLVPLIVQTYPLLSVPLLQGRTILMPPL